MDEESEIIKQVFGDSSDSEDDLEAGNSNSIARLPPFHHRFSFWESVKEIEGLFIFRNFLSTPQQSAVVSSVLNEGWFANSTNNQAMRFGSLPQWAVELSESIRRVTLLYEIEASLLPFPPAIACREPLFDQMIVNVYQPGEGICAHVDLPRFEDGIAIVSLESSCVMHFSKVDGDCGSKVPVLLTPGSLITMEGEARYLWKHEINRNHGHQIWEERELNQGRRISITLRKLAPQ